MRRNANYAFRPSKILTIYIYIYIIRIRLFQLQTYISYVNNIILCCFYCINYNMCITYNILLLFHIYFRLFINTGIIRLTL